MFCDPSGRVFRYLRLSLTKACQMRCIYCRLPGPEEELTGQNRGEPPLTGDELGALVSHLADRHGLRKVRLTGGDPTMRPDLVAIIERLAGIGAAGAAVEDLAMTTNGLTLAESAARYAAAGLRRVNISLDSLDRRRFRRITGHDLLGRVLAGIHAAVAAGLGPVKLNTVVIRGENEDEVGDLVGFAAAGGLEIRFIELMPLARASIGGTGFQPVKPQEATGWKPVPPLGPPPHGAVWAQRFVPETEVRQRLDSLVDAWEPLPQTTYSDSALRYRVRLRNGPVATVGFIAPMSRPFCAACDRLRIAADGSLMACLMGEAALPAGAASVLPALRPRLDPDRLDRIFAAAMARKPSQHAAAGHGVMLHIGG